MREKILFGTDGIRGKANVYPMTIEIALNIGKAIGKKIYHHNKKCYNHVIIGRDTRLSGYCFEQAISAGVCASGIDVSLIGVIPTPGVAFLTKKLKAYNGIIITASHNSYYDNGIKIFSHNGFKLEDLEEYRLEQQILSNNIKKYQTKKFGKIHIINNAIKQYKEYIIHSISKKLYLNNLKIVLNCANGASYKIATQLFSELGAKLIKIGITPNGYNINKQFSLSYADNISAKILKNNADLGISFDGDADRIILFDEKGKIISGDSLISIIAKDFIDNNKLNKKTLVVTDMSNLGLEKSLNPFGINIIRTSIGDRYVTKYMYDNNYNFGGEESGHLIFLNYNTTSDGLISACVLLDILIRSKQSLSSLASIFKPVPRTIINLRTIQKIKISQLKKTTALISKISNKLKNIGKVIVRNSGTENKIKVIVDSPNAITSKNYASEISKTIQKELC